MSLARLLHKQAQAAAVSPGAGPTGAPVERGNDVPAMRPEFKPLPHQLAAVQKLFDNKGRMILAHQMGSGKTVTSVFGFEKMRQAGKANKAIVVVPAGLRENFARSGVEKFTTSSLQVVGSQEEKNRLKDYVRPSEVSPDKTYTIVSYEQMRNDPIGIMKRTGADTIIADEFHKTRNDQAQIYRAMMAARPYATNFIGITGSLINNRPDEVAKLLNLSEGGPPISPRDFMSRYTRTIGSAEGFGGGKRRIIGINRPEEFAMQTVPKIDYFETGDIPGAAMPRKDVKNVYVPMSKEQYHLYQLALNKLGPVQEYVTRRDPNITLKDADKLFTQLTQARQISNSIAMGRKDVTVEQSAEKTPKVHKVLQDTAQHLQDRPDNSVVLYSNLIRGGVDVLSAGLKKAGIPHALFIGAGTEVGDGKVTNVSRSQGVEDFKNGKVKVIVLSGAGAEGLDLKNATAFYALDGHFNPERIMQAEARARRLGGQAQRPPEQRVVDVRRYQSVVPTSEQPGVLGKLVGRKTPQTTDEWAYGVAGRKFQTARQFYDVLHKPHKYIRKEYYTKRDGSRAVRYLYADQVSQPRGMFAKLMGVFKSDSPAAPPPPSTFGAS
jgi:SNF2 family DNA or RNA helicase